MPVSAPRFYDIVSQILSYDIGYDIELSKFLSSISNIANYDIVSPRNDKMPISYDLYSISNHADIE